MQHLHIHLDMTAGVGATSKLSQKFANRVETDIVGLTHLLFLSTAAEKAHLASEKKLQTLQPATSVADKVVISISKIFTREEERPFSQGASCERCTYRSAIAFCSWRRSLTHGRAALPGEANANTTRSAKWLQETANTAKKVQLPEPSNGRKRSQVTAKRSNSRQTGGQRSKVRTLDLKSCHIFIHRAGNIVNLRSALVAANAMDPDDVAKF